MRGGSFMLEEQLKALFEQYGLTDQNAVTFGHPKMRVKWALPLPGVTVYSFEQFQPFFIYFDTKGISFFPLDQKYYAIGKSFVAWDDIDNFEYKNGLMEDSFKVLAGNIKIEMKITKVKGGNPWVKANNLYLKANDHFSKNKLKSKN